MSFRDPTIPSGARGDRRRGLIYPSPFFDVAQSYMPPTIKELLKWCAYFFYTDPLLGSAVYKVAEYPITDFVYNSEDEFVRKKWKDVLEDTLNIKPFLIEIGLDFFTFGNAFISINLPFRRLIKCSDCDHQEDIREVKYRFKSWEFHYKCPGCNEEVVGKTKDVPIKSAQDINFIRWDPKNIEIEFNPLTGKSRYRYRLPNKIRKAIMQGKPEILNDVPQIFIDAAKSNKDIILSTKNLFHFKRPTLAEQDQGWGKPLIIHSMKRLFYLYVLRRAQEAIALERILPKEFVFPQPNSSMDPYSHISLANWSSRIQSEIAKFRCVSPDSFVETKDGLKRAKDIQEGDWLKNRNGDFERVTHKNERPLDPGEMAYRLHVRGQSAVKTIFSEEHPIWAARRIRGIHKSRPGTPEFVHVSELRPGDFVGYPIKRSVNDTKEIDLSEHVDRAFTEKWIYADHTETNTPLAFEYLENGGSGPDARKEFGINPTKVAQRAIRNGNGLRRIPRHIPLDEEFAYALGLYAAEGNSTPSQVLYAFNTKEVKSLDRVKRFFSKRFNANGFSATRTENCIQYFFSSSVAAQVFSSILPGISRTKRIPDAIKSAPDNIVIEFLKGIFDGDGCYYKNENKTTIKLSNLQLCEDIRQLILSFQIMPGITSEEPGVKEICGRKTKCQTSFRVQVSGNNNKRFLSLLNKEKYTGPTWSRIGIFKDGYAWFRIKAIEEAKANTVIGFSMEGDETFCTWGIATHNTDPNYTSVVPVPLGFERMGGDGRALMLGPELEIANKEIAGGMGIPLEFIMGGLCISANTLIPTSKGIVEIGTLSKEKVSKVDFEVSNHLGKSSAILAHNAGMKKEIIIRTRNGYELSAAETHPVLVISQSLDLEFKNLGDLEAGDFLVQKIGSNLWSKEQYRFDRELDFPKKNHSTFPDEMSPDLGRLLGYIASEGSIDRERVRFGNKDKNLVDDYCNLIRENFDKDPSIYTREYLSTLDNGDTFYNAELWSVDIAKFFKNIGAAKSCYEVTVPNCVLQSPREVVIEFLRGYLEGDGTISIKPNGTGFVSASSTSRKILSQIQIVFQNIGIESSIYDITGDRKKGTFRLDVRKDLKKFRDEVGLISKRKQLALESIIPEHPCHVKIPYVKEVVNKLKKENPIPRWTYRKFSPELKESFYSATSAAKALGRSDSGFILSAISEGNLKAKIDGRCIFISAKDLEEYCKNTGIPEHTKGGWPRFYKKYASLEAIQSSDMSAVQKYAPDIAKKISRMTEGDLRFDEIVSIEEGDSLIPMSDLSVPGPECYIAGGIICHNSWSGSSVSLRTLENHFLMYRRLLMRFLNFVKGHLVVHLGLPDIDLKFTEFKMADDIQRKQLVMQLNASQKISNKTLLTELGFDFEKEQKTIREEVDKMMELQEIQMKAQAKAQGEAQIMSVKYQMQAQEAQMKAQQQIQEEQGQQEGQQQPSPEQAGAEQEMAQQATAQAAQPQQQREKDQPAAGGGRMIEFDVDSIAKRWATRLMSMDQGQRNAVLADLQSRMPNMARVVMSLIGMTPAGGTAGQAQMKPLPEQKPPRREESPV